MKYIDITGDESIEELNSIISSNITTYNKMKKELEELLEAEAKEKEEKEQTSKKTTLEKKETIKEKIKLSDEEAEYYFEEFMNLEENINERYLDTLPSIKHERYYEIIEIILLKLNELLKEWNDYFHDSTLKKEELLEIKKEILLIKKRKELLIKAYNRTIKESKEDEIENQLLFLETDSGNIQAIEEIKSIDSSFYERIVELLKSIKDGTFKNVKRLVENDKVKGIPEVKGYQVRVVFERISSNQYVIISIFTKKSDSDRAYRQNLEQKIGRYKKKKSEIKKQCTDPKYIEDNLMQETNLFEKLERGYGKK